MNPQRERLRILVAVHYNPDIPHHKTHKRMFRDAWGAYGLVYDFDYADMQRKGANLVTAFADAVKAFQPHVIFTQVHNTKGGMNAEVMNRARLYVPNAVFINFNGDVWARNVLDRDTQALYRAFDLCLFTNAQLVDLACKQGICASHLPHSYEPIPDSELKADVITHDVVFTGNFYSDARIALANCLSQLPYNVGLYGQGGGIATSGSTLYDWTVTRPLYRNAKIVVSTNEFTDSRGYTSNRLWEALRAGGGVVLHQHSPDLDAMTGLRAGVHYVEWRTLDDLDELIRYYMQHPSEAQTIAQAGCAYVLRYHSPLKRVETILFDKLELLRW